MWYYLLLGEEIGPISLESLKDLVRHGDLGPSDEVRANDAESWSRVSEVPELANLEHEPTSADLDAMLVDEDQGSNGDFGTSSHDLDMMLSSEAPVESPQQRRVPRWYCKVLNQELGPFHFDALLEMVQDEEIARDDLVRSDDDSKWQRAENIVGLFTVEQRPRKQAQASGGVLSPQRAAMFKAAPKKKEELDWYNRVMGQEFGPVSWKILQAEVRAGKLSGEDEVRVTGKTDWQRVDQVPELVALLPQRPAPTPVPAPVAVQPPATPREQYTSPAAESYSPPPSQPAFNPPPSYSPPPSFAASRTAAPPPPSRSTRSAPRKSSSGGGGGGLDLSGLMSGVKLDPKVLGGIGGVVLLVLLYFSGLLGGNDGPHIAKVDAIYEKVSALAESKGEVSDWVNMGKATEAQRKEHQAELEKISSSKRPTLRVLLDVYRYTLPKIFEGTDKERADALKIFERQMKAAKKIK